MYVTTWVGIAGHRPSLYMVCVASCEIHYNPLPATTDPLIHLLLFSPDPLALTSYSLSSKYAVRLWVQLLP